MDADIHRCTVYFLPLDSLNVDYILFAIDLNDFANLLTLVMASHNLPHTNNHNLQVTD